MPNISRTEAYTTISRIVEETGGVTNDAQHAELVRMYHVLGLTPPPRNPAQVLQPEQARARRRANNGFPTAAMLIDTYSID